MARVTENQSSKIVFQQIKPSEIFLFEGRVFMKLSDVVREYNVVCLEDGVADIFEIYTYVTKINGSITLENT